jgi:hypothetical protein
MNILSFPMVMLATIFFKTVFRFANFLSLPFAASWSSALNSCIFPRVKNFASLPPDAMVEVKEAGRALIDGKPMMLRLRVLANLTSRHLNQPRALARMSSTLPYTSEACCQIPPVQSSYKPKGEKIALGDYTEVYSVGDNSASSVVIG